MATKRFVSSVRRLKEDLDLLVRRMNHLHKRGEMFFQAGQLDGGRMRNLDDAHEWLKNVQQEALGEFLNASKKGGDNG